jgi:hypothetical protein
VAADARSVGCMSHTDIVTELEQESDPSKEETNQNIGVRKSGTLKMKLKMMEPR